MIVGGSLSKIPTFAPAGLVFVLLLASLGCEGKGHAKVQGVLIPQADAYYPAPTGGVELIIPDSVQEQPALPSENHVKLVIGRKVPWRFVSKLLSRLESEKKQVTILVGNRHRVFALKMSDELKTRAPIEVTATEDGKACVQLPRAKKAKCTQSPDGRYVPRSGVRQVVREAMKAMKIHDTQVMASPALHWADVVRAVDGARTCCGKGEMRVSLHREKRQK